MEISKSAVQDLCGWAQRHPNVEVCGIVARGPKGDRVIPMRNVHRQPDRYYEWATGDMVREYDLMDGRGEHPIAFYHSHPSGRPTPSDTDMTGAFNVGMHYLILYPEGGLWMVSAWECVSMGILIGASLEVRS